ncbi:pyridoxal-phosphate dependent enzyme [Pelagivirga sediminicola]|uniref:pyridoxal-phosphate dependent enzyme n=1 Tax=Pelagivirga sediminicola TaxID=2170575 RepID=UPI001FAEA50B|nr:pyridoxal-phosphate dependent enzyme [Pelagivirga sediminicola]
MRTFADGMAVRVPVAGAFDSGAERIVAVSDEEIAEAMLLYFCATHNVVEGAGAAPLAALMQEKDLMAGRRVALIASGGNVDTGWFRQVLEGATPVPA